MKSGLIGVCDIENDDTLPVSHESLSFSFRYSVHRSTISAGFSIHNYTFAQTLFAGQAEALGNIKGIMPTPNCEEIAFVLEYPKGFGTKQVALQTDLSPHHISQALSW